MIVMDINHFQRQALNDQTDLTKTSLLNEANSLLMSQNRNNNNKRRREDEGHNTTRTTAMMIPRPIMGVQRGCDEHTKMYSDMLPLGRSTLELPSLPPETFTTCHRNFFDSLSEGLLARGGATLLPGRRTRSIGGQIRNDDMAEVVTSGDAAASCALEKHVFGCLTYEAENDSSSYNMSLEPRPIKDINGIKSFASTATQLCRLSETALLPTLAASNRRKRNTMTEEESGLIVGKYSCPFPPSLVPSTTISAAAVRHQGGAHHNKKLSNVMAASITNNEERATKKAKLLKPTQGNPKEEHPCGGFLRNLPSLKEYKPDHSPPPSPTSSLPKTQHDCTISMARDEDCNWLSEFQCLVRSDVLELFVTTNHTTTTNMNQQSESPPQEVVGIRCRFCAQQEVRAGRSTAFPSDVSKIYQSVSMMIRDHIPKCSAMPMSLQLRLKNLQNSAKQSAWGVKHYWEYSASALGLVDTPNGLHFDNKCIKNKHTDSSSSVDINQNSSTTTNMGNQEMKAYMPPFGKAVNDVMSTTGIPLVTENDGLMTPPAFYFEVMKQVELVYLDRSEIHAYRRVLKQGHSGFGCIYCGEAGRMGFSRKFPMTQKSLPSKIEEMSTHLIRCSLCPKPVQRHLRDLCCKERLTPKMKEKKNAFMDLIWKRLWIDDKRVELNGLDDVVRLNSGDS